MKEHTLPAELIATKTIDGYVYLDISGIIRIEADHKHTRIYCLGEPKVTSRNIDLT